MKSWQFADWEESLSIPDIKQPRTFLTHPPFSFNSPSFIKSKNKVNKQNTSLSLPFLRSALTLGPAPHRGPQPSGLGVHSHPCHCISVYPCSLHSLSHFSGSTKSRRAHTSTAADHILLPQLSVKNICCSPRNTAPPPEAIGEGAAEKPYNDAISFQTWN